MPHPRPTNLGSDCGEKVARPELALRPFLSADSGRSTLCRGPIQIQVGDGFWQGIPHYLMYGNGRNPMSNSFSRELEVFAEALQRGSASERQSYLDQACAQDAELRQRFDALLQAHDVAGPFL